MSWLDVYTRWMTWADYLCQQKALAERADPANAENLLADFRSGDSSYKLALSEQEYRAAMMGGLGALRKTASGNVRGALHTLDCGWKHWQAALRN